MKKILIGLSCVMSMGCFLSLNELKNKEKELEIVITQHQEEMQLLTAQKDEELILLAGRNEQYREEIQELTNRKIDLKEMFQIAGKVYQVDSDMLLAISKLETSHFTSDLFLKYNNPGGIKDFSNAEGWAKYSTQFEGIMEMARLLRRNYLDQGLFSLEEIGSKYCPDSTDEWVAQVKSLMGQE